MTTGLMFHTWTSLLLLEFVLHSVGFQCLNCAVKGRTTLSEPSTQPQSASESAFVQLATVLRGARPLEEKSANDTFHGQLMVGENTIKSAIIKDLDPRQLANELMVAALAYAAGMPIPGAHLAMVPNDVLPVKKGPSIPNGGRLVFGSADAQTPPVAQLYKGQGADGMMKVRKRIAEWDVSTAEQ